VNIQPHQVDIDELNATVTNRAMLDKSAALQLDDVNQRWNLMLERIIDTKVRVLILQCFLWWLNSYLASFAVLYVLDNGHFLLHLTKHTLFCVNFSADCQCHDKLYFVTHSSPSSEPVQAIWMAHVNVCSGCHSLAGEP